jgi:nucleotide-binding universal stress UspA family protein
MTFKDVLVHVDASRAGLARLELAIDIARGHDAYLTGIFIGPSPDILALAENQTALALALDLAEIEEGVEAAKERFEILLRRHNVLGEWLAVNGPAASSITSRARTADIVILGQSDPRHVGALQAPEDVVLTCGGPSLIVPYAGRFQHVGERALVAWNGSREARRAVHDALPFLAASKSVTILSVNPETDDQTADNAELIRHLGRHGLKVSVEVMVTKDLTVFDAVATRAAELATDLVVMGAYGRWRWREMVLGGMTHDMLHHMIAPVLMAH